MQSTQFGAPSWKCTHGNYSPYCSSCRGADNGFRTYAECCKIKPIVEFAVNAGTGKLYPNCSQCVPPRVFNPKPAVAGRCRVCDAEIELTAQRCASLMLSRRSTENHPDETNARREARQALHRTRSKGWRKRNPERLNEQGLQRRDRYGVGNITRASWLPV
jgi:hypothetical protein